jgi:hypothetical protein
MRGRALALKVCGTVAVFAALVPTLVVLAPVAGLEPTHWSGVRLRYVELPLLRHGVDIAPEPANILLSNAATMDESDAGDVAPSYWDADAGQVVLGAVTERGMAMRRTLGDSAGVAYRVDRRSHSARELATIMNDVLPWAEHGAVMSSVDPRGNRVVLGVVGLSHGLFTDIADRYGDAMTVVVSPFMPLAYLDERPAHQPSWWDRTKPGATWFTLVTGFPWYLVAGLAATATIWLTPTLRRQRRPAHADHGVAAAS